MDIFLLLLKIHFFGRSLTRAGGSRRSLVSAIKKVELPPGGRGDSGRECSDLPGGECGPDSGVGERRVQHIPPGAPRTLRLRWDRRRTPLCGLGQVLSPTPGLPLSIPKMGG